jgi:glycosyltransferase involved in cell wall biosynthesis
MVRFAMELPRLQADITRLARKLDVDLVYVNGPRVLTAASQAAKKLVFHSHSLLSTRSARLLAAISLRKPTTHAIASSHFVAKPLAAVLPPERLSVIYNGVADYQGPRPFRERITVGMLGRIAPEKGQLDFLHAARVVHQAMPECRFVICGNAQHSTEDYVAEVHQSAADLPVKFLDWQKDVGPVLRELDLLVLPSSAVDATPRVILEAASAGVPVVAYPVGGIPELIQQGVNGLLSAESNPESLAASIRILLTDASAMIRLGGNARRTYESRFTLERYRQEVLAVLERI